MQQGDNLFSLLMIGALCALFYFVLIRPQNQRAKAQRALLASLKKGDEVITVGGIIGSITTLGDHYLKLTVANGCEISIQHRREHPPP